jgi:hypothetical protein
MASDADSLRAAILSLYGMAGLAQEQANSWLNSFSRSLEAWQACMQLLEPSERPEVCFFCANMLLSKVRTDWHKLSAEQQTQIGAVIRWVRQLYASGTSHISIVVAGCCCSTQLPRADKG